MNDRRAEAVTAKRVYADSPEHKTIAAERSVRWVFSGRGAAATPEDRQSEQSDVCRSSGKREVPFAGGACLSPPQRSSGATRRQGGSPLGADGARCKAAGGAE